MRTNPGPARCPSSATGTEAMSLADELAKLDELRQRGVLSDAELSRAKDRLLGDPPTRVPAPVVSAVNGLRRSRSDRWIGGVCGGVANATGMESWAWRLIFAVLFFFGGVGLVLYLLLWIFVPSEQPTSRTVVSRRPEQGEQ